MHGVAAFDAGQFRNNEFCDKSSDDVDEKQAEELLPQADDVHADKCNVEEISEGDDELIDEKFDDDAVLVGVVAEVLLVFGEPFGEWAVDLLVKHVGHQDVHQVGDLGPVGRGVEDASWPCPARYRLEVQKFMVLVHKTSGV